MSSGAFILEIMLRGIAMGALATLAAGLWRPGVGANARWGALLTCLGVSGYAIAMNHALCQAMGPAHIVAIWLSYAVSAYVWLFVVVVFDDQPVGPRTLAPAALMTALGVVASWQPEGSLREAMQLARDGITLLLSLHALTLVVRSRPGDLVEARRRLRGPFFAVVSGYIIFQTGLDALIRSGFAAPWRNLVSAGGLALLTVLAAGVFLESRSAVFGAARRPMAPSPAQATAASAATDAALAALNRAMDRDQAWRQEGLTVGALAAMVGLPEHRLRRLINDQLGHRNFASFVNARRIAAAQAALSDPAQARITIAALAYDLGFGSLGPFNRAFKDATRTTPRAWRRQALGETFAEIENVA
jgi:AraC-like DNA-binding protein